MSGLVTSITSLIYLLQRVIWARKVSLSLVFFGLLCNSIYQLLINTLDGFKSLIGQNPVTWGCINGRYKDGLWKKAIKWPINQHTLCKNSLRVACTVSHAYLYSCKFHCNFAHLRVRAENVSILRERVRAYYLICPYMVLFTATCYMDAELMRAF